jgi:uncharacterized protein YecE (DUF72 family)
MKKWLIGCSGFSYKHWRNRFYPEGLSQKNWFEYYCEHFNTVELNVTFYRLPRPETFRGWYERSPADFKFTVKAPRLVTHYKKFRNMTTEITGFYDIVLENLRDKLGSILFQMHPRFEYSDENLELLVKHLDPAFSNVLEFRHSSWWNEKVYKALRKNNICFCSISYPGLPDDVIKTSDVVYYRFHGVPKLYLSPYTTAQLRSVARNIQTLRGAGTVYAYFNNDIDVHAIDNAKVLQTFIGQSIHIDRPPVMTLKPSRAARKKSLG